MTKRLSKTVFICIALAFAAAAPAGAQTVREAALNKQLAWCPEHPNRIAVRGLQEGVDLEPHQAAVLAACADVETRDVMVLGTFSASVPVANRRDEGWQRRHR
jgi:hypothetical protein